ncbi:flagellar biosynthesis protein FlhF [Marinomonas mediterranea]|jgi:flagellar biosynthetic protein FlhF
MRQAIRKVRDAVGPDAVILSNQRLPSGEIEITTALDYDGSLPSGLSSSSPSGRDYPLSSNDPKRAYQERLAQARNSQPPTQRPSPEPTTFSNDSFSAARRDEPSQIEEALSIKNSESPSQLIEMERELERLKSELKETKEQIEDKAEHSAKSNYSETPEQYIQGRLVKLGLSDIVIEKIVDHSNFLGREDDWKKALSRLADYLPVARQDMAHMSGCIAFMGPTGVGKTTSIGKIAAQHVLKNGADSVVLVTTDTYRIAAHEQLRTFGRILNVPVEVVNEYSDLNEVLDKYSNYSLVLVDTAGMNPRDRNLERQLKMMQKARGYLKKLLVLPCTSQRQVLKTVVDVYSQIQLDGCVLSKIDESASLGEAISVVIEEGLPVMYVADGQRIPDDIEPARAHNLISRAVYTAEQYGQLYGSLKYGS